MIGFGAEVAIGKIQAIYGKFETMAKELEDAMGIMADKVNDNNVRIKQIGLDNLRFQSSIERAGSVRRKLLDLVS